MKRLKGWYRKKRIKDKQEKKTHTYAGLERKDS